MNPRPLTIPAPGARQPGASYPGRDGRLADEPAYVAGLAGKPWIYRVPDVPHGPDSDDADERREYRIWAQGKADADRKAKETR
jgi:hypothetical protein